MLSGSGSVGCVVVSLFTREWIEIGMRYTVVLPDVRLPLYEGVD